MNINNISMEQSRTAYHFFSVLCGVLQDYSFQQNEEKIPQLKAIIQSISVGMPLPSGRYGNALAVALEMQLYPGALFIIKNADDLGIVLNSVSSEFGGKNVWDARQTFEMSQLGFDKTKISNDDDFYKKYPWYIEAQNANIDAALEISKILQNKKNTR